MVHSSRGRSEPMTSRSHNRLWMVWALALATIGVAVLPASALSCAEPFTGAAGVQDSCASGSCAMMRRGECGLHPTGRVARRCVVAHAPSDGCHCGLRPLQTLPPAALESSVSGTDLHDAAVLPGLPTALPSQLAGSSAALPSSFRPRTSDIRSCPPRGPPASFPSWQAAVRRR
jgi:hypothetical protein